MPPLVSVIVPVFNCERFLAEALRSIFSQDHRPLEVIVVDDGSTDGSADVARTFPEVILISQKNGGVSSARNTGLAAAHGELIAWLDGDDYWLPGKLSTEIRHLAENPTTGITLCHQRAFLNPGDSEPPWFRNPRAQNWLSRSLYASLIRRKVFDLVGNFDVTLRTGEDFDWFLRAQDAGVPLDELEPIMVHHRVRPDSLTGDAPRTQQEMIAVARMSLRRRRSSRAT